MNTRWYRRGISELTFGEITIVLCSLDSGCCRTACPPSLASIKDFLAGSTIDESVSCFKDNQTTL